MAKRSSASSQPARLKRMTSADIANREWTEKERRALRRVARMQAAGDDSGGARVCYGRNFPKTDFNYHNASLAGCGARCGATFRAPSFRDISRDYLNREARNNFLIEAALFAMIVITAALPLLNGAHALAGLVRSLGVI